MSESPEIATLRARMRDGRRRGRARSFFRHRTRPKLIAFMEEVDRPEARPLISRLRSCRRTRPCRMVSCPVCGEKLKAAARDRVLTQIVERLGRFPHDVEVTFVTIDGPYVDLADHARARAEVGRFRKSVDNFIRRRLPGTGWVGFTDVSVDGLVHLHVVLVHPDTPRNVVRDRLTQSFPGPNQVRVSEWDRSKSVAENLQSVIVYAVRADRHVEVNSLRDGPDLVQTAKDPVRIVKRILLVQALAGRGTEGLSFRRNMKPLHRGIKVSELDSLLRRTKRIRPNTKSMPTMPWAPRGVPGTHLRKPGVREEYDLVPMNTATDADSTGGVSRVTRAAHGEWGPRHDRRPACPVRRRSSARITGLLTTGENSNGSGINAPVRP